MCFLLPGTLMGASGKASISCGKFHVNEDAVLIGDTAGNVTLYAAEEGKGWQGWMDRWMNTDLS